MLFCDSVTQAKSKINPEIISPEITLSETEVGDMFIIEFTEPTQARTWLAAGPRVTPTQSGPGAEF